MKRKILLLWFLTISIFAFAQSGKLLLVGGGSERSNANSWNGEAFPWAVEQAENHKVAVVSFSSDNDFDWYMTYFVTNCGAEASDYFILNTVDAANSEATYNSLMEYDMFYFLGGDQSNYYETYQNTLVEQAIEDKFVSGGVIAGTSAGMSILSDVFFAALNGSAYPNECIEDPLNEQITLRDDFLSLFPGAVFDTHFAERGRFARLIGFMANWKLSGNENIIGVGVDDLTCLAIDENKLAEVYGTGAVRFYAADNNNTFSTGNDGKLLADKIHVNQLIQGCTYNFNTGEYTGLSTLTEPEIIEETGMYTVLASGGDSFNDNTSLVSDLVQIGNLSDSILIITGTSVTNAFFYKSNIESNGASNVEVRQGLTTMSSDSEMQALILTAKKFLFMENDYQSLMDFINTEGNGQLLYEQLRKDNMTIAFVGDNSRFAGHTVIAGYEVSGASYYAELEYLPGLDLLQTSVVMPNAYTNSDYYENTMTAVPYAMVLDGLTYGMWITNKSYIKMAASGGKNYINSYGSHPVMILKHEGSNTGFSMQTSSGTGGAARMVAGFEQATLSFIDESTPYKVSEQVISSIESTNFEQNSISVYPNPASDFVCIDNVQSNLKYTLYSVSGNVVKTGIINSNAAIYTGSLTDGVYILELSDNAKISRVKLIVK